MTSWKIEVQVFGDKKWYGNAVRCETKAEAEDYARDLLSRWTQSTNFRIVESKDEITGKVVNGRMNWLDQVK